MGHTCAGAMDRRRCIGMVLSIELLRLLRKHCTNNLEGLVYESWDQLGRPETIHPTPPMQ